MRPKLLQHTAKDLDPPDLPHMVGATATLTSTASAGTDWTQADPLSSAPFGGVAGQKAKAGAAFLLADGLVVVAVLWALFHVRNGGALGGTGRPLVPDLLIFSAIVQIGLKVAVGLYPGYGALPEARLRHNALAWLGAGMIATIAGLGLAGAGLAAIALLWACLGVVGLLQASAAMVVRRLLRANGLPGLPVRVVGETEAVEELAKRLTDDPGIGFVPVHEEDAPHYAVLWAATALPDRQQLEALSAGGREVILVSDLPKLPLSGVSPNRHGGDLGLRLVRARPCGLPDPLKRLTDLCLVVPLLVLAAPVVLLGALLVRLADPGPAFYVQPREGQGGRRIGILKLRTMYLDSEQMLSDLLERNPEARAEWAEHFKLRRDPRVLPFIGHFLRASSIDELPQLWNVLRGEMSLVGPRPFPEYHLEAMPPAFRARRAMVVPGLTGLWQISERGSADLATAQALDDHYISVRSFWGDLSILLRTLPAVIGRRGAF